MHAFSLSVHLSRGAAEHLADHVLRPATPGEFAPGPRSGATEAQSDSGIGRSTTPRLAPSCASRRFRQRGFALLVTIVLVSFLVLLLVGLATFTRVETQVATNAQTQAQARQNALMALNIAVGQLQKYAGPDQRTTARADLENSSAANLRWTGVYGSSVAADYSDTPATLVSSLTDLTKVNSYGSSARLLNWLVSGNEATPFDPGFGSANVGAKGEIVSAPAAASIHAKPADPVANLAATTTAASLDLYFNNDPAQKGRMLVGPNSVTSALSGSTPVDYVVAPAVDIRVPASAVPGAGATGNVSIGRYAWWVGDEGMKARVNLPLAGSDTSPPSIPSADLLAEKRNAFSSSTRSAIELMGRDNGTALNATPIGSLYLTGLDLKKIMSLQQAPMVSATPADLATALKHRFHDATAHSRSVLSDTYFGGLKKDLSHILANNASGPANGSALWTPATTTENTSYIPSWGHLRSFYNTTATSNVITPQLPIYDNTVNYAGTTDQIGISPVLTYAALGFRYSTAAAPAAGVAINLDIYPVVVLWNPYANKMAMHTYEVGIRTTYASSHQGVKLSVNMGTDDTPNWVVKEVRDLARPGVSYPATDADPGSPNDNANIQSALRYWRFKVVCPQLNPGESRVFTLGNATETYNAGQNELVATSYNPHHHATLSGTTMLAGEVGRNFKFEPFNSSRLRSGASAELGAYLGDGTAPPLTVAGTWDQARNGWFQSIQGVDYKGISDSFTEYQGAEPLNVPLAIHTPAVKLLLMNTFSAIGRGWTLNSASGTNISTFRWIAQGNNRAPYIFRTKRDANYVAPYYSRAGVDDKLWPLWFLENPTDATRASSGMSLDYDIGTSTNANKTIDATLFEFRENGQQITSVGQLQHAGVSLAGAYPSYPIGNAIADFRLPNTKWLEATAGTGIVYGSDHPSFKQPRYYDISWLTNRTLWDRYFFSTVPQAGAKVDPELPRIVRYGDTSANLRANADIPAANLLLSGGFNINSTSEQAWRAVLGGLNQLAYNPETDASGSMTGVAIPRFRRPTAGTARPTGVLQLGGGYAGDTSSTAFFTGDDLKSLWQGYRVLSPEEIAQLARNLVAEIRIRGPFVSLGDFVNRRIIDSDPFVNTAAPNDGSPVKATLTAQQKSQFLSAMKGAIQAAIDATTINTGSSYSINHMDTGSYWANTRRGGLEPTHAMNANYSRPLARGDINSGSTAAELTPQRTTAAFAPKFLTQADVLSAIGAGLAARSDTFTVRSYGETLNPATGELEGRAWCEAVVQRLPEYMDDSMPAETDLASAPNSAAKTTNQNFGRRFKIISFRWLSPNDI